MTQRLPRLHDAYNGSVNLQQEIRVSQGDSLSTLASRYKSMQSSVGDSRPALPVLNFTVGRQLVERQEKYVCEFETPQVDGLGWAVSGTQCIDVAAS